MIGIGETKFFGTVEVHRYASSVHVRDRANGGKRGKVCPGFAVYGLDRARDDEPTTLRCVEAIEAAAGDGYEAMLQAAQAVVELDGRGDIENRTEKGVRVPPADFRTISILGEYVFAEADYNSFRVRDLEDRYNEPTRIPPCHGGERTAVKLFREFLARNAERVRTMRFREVSDAMHEAGISSHYYCAVD